MPKATENGGAGGRSGGERNVNERASQPPPGGSVCSVRRRLGASLQAYTLREVAAQRTAKPMKPNNEIHRGGAVGMVSFLVVCPVLFFLIADNMGVKLQEINGEQFFSQYGFSGVLKLYGIPVVAGVIVALVLKVAIGNGNKALRLTCGLYAYLSSWL